ncbi:hypothetical protein EB796_008382 [Bugula neritina]|uniref:Uncharacterized protein n=1 Tax=Bugula neritina TaxID=10212 RepID=A0A7J7K6S9_BUGNE|nr:hypothetical protein EB796_008382 [Bugula neritina]
MYENGIAIQWDEMDLQFTCNTAECKLQIAVTTSAKVVNLSWKILISSILLVSTYLRDSWKLLLLCWNIYVHTVCIKMLIGQENC